ncbi:arsenosugar biosynthesis radical SAM (seleno)protein ArsS [Methylobacter sp. Wu8]|uniref:arsenosugar biosynthesis radical SAM (seleno)protein ArsS n=1 Tax=Methylobacter sp. Wu8 TaxID=3118457 RepID=UPI002F343955
MLDSLPYLKNSDFPAISRNKLEILQVNLGYLCNLSCTHCHVNAGPKRTELMDKATMDEILTFIDSHAIHTLDLTGGAPEMNPHFRYLVTQALDRGLKVIDRCNLVILMEPGFEWLAGFLAKNRVEIVASLPCYLKDNVDKQRGKGTFDASITALQKLNALGYGQVSSDLQLNLVFNPQGATLPPEQQALERDYKQHLHEHFGIVFNHLFALANLPVQRFGSVLLSTGQFDNYMNLLKNNFQAPNLDKVMCKNTLSVDWQGKVYDCDFNQMLKLPLGADNKTHIRQISELTGKAINTLQHCYACTAGQGSSCSGAI